MNLQENLEGEGLLPFLTRITIRKLMTSNPYILRSIINLALRPTLDQKSYIYNISNEYCKGSIIMENIASSKDDWTAIQRLKLADIIIFEIHGLCPKNPYPIAKNHCLQTFQYLVYQLGISPLKIVITCDSAGGSLALEMLIDMYAPRILENVHNNLDAPRENFDMPIPAGAFFSSPLVSADTSTPSYQKNHKKDIVSMKLSKILYKEYMVMPDRNFPDNIPVMHLQDIRYGFARFLPRQILVYVGTKESLLDSVIRWVTDMKEDGGSINVQLHLEPYYHDWFMCPLLVKKKNRAIIDKYTQLFVDWAVHAVQQANDSAK
ncbi:hypothetical protein BDF20DRAFT_903996 [Mycotypha africana]|uniref:uncharacterized protein n=1 Tax=Mycotypha africana TaxID=64632 RepID=UPI0022FFD7DE|nr:uncharacterized protein BDF20DRAFT_903996 [Mycotypha africana]KAI8991225.1 hypothetical protein BDF20DRAFT_903996 [Mycotypha africana]